MDRFIVDDFEDDKHRDFHLKSSMDRFIDCPSNRAESINSLFKIQYGQIYRINK